MQIVRWIVGSAVFLALLFLSLQNADPVTLKFFQLASWEAPLVFVVFVAFAAGAAPGTAPASGPGFTRHDRVAVVPPAAER